MDFSKIEGYVSELDKMSSEEIVQWIGFRHTVGLYIPIAALNRVSILDVVHAFGISPLLNLNSSHRHSWKTYDSGWSKYEFCEHCDEKKEI